MLWKIICLSLSESFVSITNASPKGFLSRRERSRPTLAFSCGARSAFKLKEKDYLRNMLSRRQLQGFVGQQRKKHYMIGRLSSLPF
jgi:hypothetical protein